MDSAIEAAAEQINKKEEKKHKKHCNTCSKNHSKHETCNCDDVKLQIEEGKDSKVMKSPQVNRKCERREGVAEKNETERKLVTETLRVIVRNTNMGDYNFN